MNYHHTHVIELPRRWRTGRAVLEAYFREAHSDAISHLAALASDSLHPCATPPPPYDGYPHTLPTVTLQGYFGEVFAAFLAENHGVGGHNDWHVPAHLFRFHLHAFQYLEQRSQMGTAPAAIIGRPGDDCLAFRRDAVGRIIAVLFCEAKCTVSHDAGLIREAHQKASTSAIVNIMQLIEVLKSDPSEITKDWIASLRVFQLELHTHRVFDRYDSVCYVHETPPTRNTTWMPTTAPHPDYSGGRTLHVFEVRLSNVSRRLHAIYAAAVWT